MPSGSLDVRPACKAQVGGALPVLKGVLDHVLPLVLRDFPGPGRHAQRGQRHCRHGSLHQFYMVCKDTGSEVSRQEVQGSIDI